MDAQDAGGYDHTFVSDVADDLTCVMCHLVMKGPVQVVDCGHRFCKSCFETLKEFSVTREIELCCPLDRGVIDPNKVFLDKATERQILNLFVKCPNNDKGCTWSKELKDTRCHIKKDCGFESVKCGNGGCDSMIQRRLLAEHSSICFQNGELLGSLDQWRKKIMENKKQFQKQLRQIGKTIERLEARLDDESDRKHNELHISTLMESLKKDITNELQESWNKITINERKKSEYKFGQCVNRKCFEEQLLNLNIKISDITDELQENLNKTIMDERTKSEYKFGQCVNRRRFEEQLLNVNFRIYDITDDQKSQERKLNQCSLYSRFSGQKIGDLREKTDTIRDSIREIEVREIKVNANIRRMNKRLEFLEKKADWTQRHMKLVNSVLVILIMLMFSQIFVNVNIKMKNITDAQISKDETLEERTDIPCNDAIKIITHHDEKNVSIKMKDITDAQESKNETLEEKTDIPCDDAIKRMTHHDEKNVRYNRCSGITG